MANGHGGNRTPSKPAAVSGPGALSRRTDGGPGQPVRDTTGGAYGDAQAFRGMQQQSPMASAPATPPMPPGGGSGQPMTATPLHAPSAMPDVPVTDGAAAGAGAGMDALGLPSADMATQDAEYLKRYLPVLIRQAQRDDAPPSLKKYVRTLLTQL